jgi:two-component system sensor histidine kinase YesM
MIKETISLSPFVQKKSVIFAIFLTFLLVNMVIFLAMVFFTTNNSSNILTGEITVYTEKIIEQAIANLDYNLADVQSPLIMLSNNKTILTCLQDYQNMSDADKYTNKKEILNVIAGYWLKPLISDLIIVGNNGFFFNSTENSLKWDYDFLGQPWYKNAEKKDNTFINFGLHLQNYYNENIYRKSDRLTISIGLPVKASGGAELGTVLCDLELSKLNDILKLNTFEKSGYIFLTDDRGKILAHKNSDLIGEDFGLKDRSVILNGKQGSFITEGPEGKLLLVYHTSRIAGLKLISVIPINEIEEHSLALKRNIIRIFMISLLVQVIVYFIVVLFISKPFKKLIHSIDNVRLEDLSVKSGDYQFWELNVIGRKFEELIERLKNLIRENYDSKLSLKEAELENLQAQINPHMLYNTLQILQTEIVCGNIEESDRIVLSLSELFRYSVHKEKEMVYISQEIQYLENYFNLCSRRFDGNLKAVFDISEEVYNFKIPRLLFQPIIENCIIHGFKECPENGEILISARIVPEGILISVRDNGGGIGPARLEQLIRHINDPSAADSNIGLRNVHQRIRLKYGERYGISLRSVKGEYTVVDMLIARFEGGHRQ